MTNAIDPTRRRTATDSETESEPPRPGGQDRAARDASAYARYESFVASSEAASGHDAPLDCRNFRRPTEAIADPVLFLQQPDTNFDVSWSDIHQGRLGDCYVMATLAALAATPAGRGLIQNAITENRDGRGELVSYSVKLYQPTGPGSPPALVPCTVQVGTRFVDGHARPSGSGNAGDPRQEVWSLVLEQAYAAVNGGYRGTACGGVASTAMAVFTGQWPDSKSTKGLFAYRVDDMRRDLAAGKAVVLSTPPESKLKGSRETLPPDESTYISAEHAYAVLDVVKKSGELFVRIYNPWGTEPPLDMPAKHLGKWFVAADVTRGK
jgi:hypothetical protein